MKKIIQNKQVLKITAVVALLTITACNQSNESTSETPTAHQAMKHEGHAEQMTAQASKTYRVGDVLPKDEVCMVNDEHMGKKQFEVPFDGKVYYGCCAMCVERIPADESVRVAIDPFSKKTVDKSEAYIVLVNERGTVSYFENEDNYKKFLNL